MFVNITVESGHSSPILCASFSPTGNLLATGSGDTHVRLWDLFTETPSHTLAGHTGWVLCVEWDPLERKLASGGHDGHVRLWDPKTGKPLGDAMKGHSKWVTSLAWEPLHLCVIVYGVSQHDLLLTYQKPIYPTVGILVEGWNCASMVDGHTKTRIRAWGSHCQCKRYQMGRRWFGWSWHTLYGQ